MRRSQAQLELGRRLVSILFATICTSGGLARGHRNQRPPTFTAVRFNNNCQHFPATVYLDGRRVSAITPARS